MSYPQTSFSQLLERYYRQNNVPLNSGGTAFEPGAAIKYKAAGWLTDACALIWNWNPHFMLPSTVDTATVTPASGIVAAADIAQASRWSFWTEDPQPLFIANLGCIDWSKFRSGTPGSAGSVLVPDAGSSTLFAFYQRQSPRFSVTEWAAATAYAADTVVWHVASGQCYLALQAITASPSIAITDTAFWRVQQVPTEMLPAVLALMAQDQSIKSEAKPVKGGVQTILADREIEKLYERWLIDAQPWFYHNGGRE